MYTWGCIVGGLWAIMLNLIMDITNPIWASIIGTMGALCGGMIANKIMRDAGGE